MHVRKQEGFTLIELLIVIALIAVLAGAVIIALNPARQFQQARDSERWSHVSAIAGAITQNITENKGVWTCSNQGATTLPASSTRIASAGGINLCSCLVPNFTAALPYDPSNGNYTDCSSYDTGYSVSRDAATGRVTVSAVGEVSTSSISVTQ